MPQVREHVQQFMELLIHASVSNRRTLAKKFQRKLSMEVVTKYTKQLAHEEDHVREEIVAKKAFKELKEVREFQVYEEPVFRAIFNGLLTPGDSGAGRPGVTLRLCPAALLHL